MEFYGCRHPGIQDFSFINKQKILAHSKGFGYFHLVIPINIEINIKVSKSSTGSESMFI